MGTRQHPRGRQRDCAARAAVILALLLLLPATRSFALDPTSRISQYGHTSWRVQDGYFGGQPTSFAQTTDGYLWVGAATGVFRFDGVKFVPWDSIAKEKLPSNGVHGLLGGRDGSLWIATTSGLLQWVNHRSTSYLGVHQFSNILQDDKGVIWVLKADSSTSPQPICRISGTNAQCYGYGASAGRPLSAAVALARDASGNLWIGHDMAVVEWMQGVIKLYRPAALHSHQGIGGVQGLAVDADGSIWVGMNAPGHQGGLQHIVDGVLKPFVVPRLNSETLEVGSNLLIDRQGNLWVGTVDRGIYRIHGNEVDHFGSADGLSGDNVNRFFEDREGNLWIATTNGVDMLRDVRVTTISKREGLSEDGAESVLAARDGTVWIGSDQLQAFIKGSVSPELGKGLPGNWVTCLFEDHTGRLWAGMNNTLWIHEGGTKNGTFRQIKRTDGSAIGMVRGLAEDSEHNIWVQINGPPATLFRIQDLKIREEFPEPPTPRAFKLAPDSQSGIWLAPVDGDLARIRSGKVETFAFGNHPKGPLQVQTERQRIVHALFAAPDGSILGGTASGVLGWRNGKQQILTVRNGLPCEEVNGLISDDQGDLWLYAACGLIEISKDEVQRWWEEPESKLKMRVFDALDGVQGGLSAFSGSSKGPDGRLWFANSSTVQTVDPAQIAGNTVPPPVHIEGIVANRKSYSPTETINLPAPTRDLEIDYTALSFVAPKKVLFRYMLVGRDTTWQEPGTRRQAFYTDLRPGTYRFRVIACNNDGVWNETGASLGFSVLPAYYQTTWFFVLSGAVFLLLLWFVYQFRLRQLRYQFNIGLEAQVNERTRIARELHDTLLQSFQGAVFQFQAARRLLLRNADNAMVVVDEAIHLAEEGIAEGRAAIRDLRPEPAAQRDLPKLLNDAGRELATGYEMNASRPNYRVVIEGKQHDLLPMLQDEVYRISREMIRNAFSHAAASHIEVEIRYDQDQFRLRVRDDGKGIDPKILEASGQSGHFGLTGMRERAQRIGVRLDFWSEMGAGTEVELTIPASMAYQKQRDGRRFRLFHWAGRDE